MGKLADLEFQIQRLGKNDTVIAEQLAQLFKEVFRVEKAGAPNDGYIKALLAKPNFICFAAFYKNEIAGGLTAYELPIFNQGVSELLIYDVAVKPACQRMGLGKKLIEAIKEYADENEIKTIFVDANEEDQGALDFYRAMDMKEEKVVQFTFDCTG